MIVNNSLRNSKDYSKRNLFKDLDITYLLKGRFFSSKNDSDPLVLDNDSNKSIDSLGTVIESDSVKDTEKGWNFDNPISRSLHTLWMLFVIPLALFGVFITLIGMFLIITSLFEASKYLLMNFFKTEQISEGITGPFVLPIMSEDRKDTIIDVSDNEVAASLLNDSIDAAEITLDDSIEIVDNDKSIRKGRRPTMIASGLVILIVIANIIRFKL